MTKQPVDMERLRTEAALLGLGSILGYKWDGKPWAEVLIDDIAPIIRSLLRDNAEMRSLLREAMEESEHFPRILIEEDGCWADRVERFL